MRIQTKAALLLAVFLIGACVASGLTIALPRPEYSNSGNVLLNSSDEIANVRPVQVGTYSATFRNSYGPAANGVTALVVEGANAIGIVGVPFVYQIIADNNPNRYSASSLPPGLHFDSLTGIISGTPSRSGTYQAFVEAINNHGSASATIVITIKEGSLISPGSAIGVVGVPFAYVIVADNDPNSYSASSLPPGLHFDSLTGIISGTPSRSGTYQVFVQTRNNYGSASATIAITIKEGSIISAPSSEGIVGVPFAYQVVADNNPNRYSASSLPPGLHFDSLTGIISGTPSRSGTYQVFVQARNNYGSASATIVIIIKEGSIISARSTQGIVGVPFSYQIVADNNPNRYSASSLPSGLHFDVLTGIISGTPRGAGTYPVIVQAINNYGSASATVSIIIKEGSIISAASTTGIVGVPFIYQIVADNNPNRYSASSLPSGLRFDSLSGIISGTPSGAGINRVTVEARNNYGSASATIVITIKEGSIAGGTVAGGTVSQPNLSISRVGDVLVLTWPASVGGFGLEETSSLQGFWSTSQVAVDVQGNNKVASIPFQSTRKFYRLRRSSQ